MKILASLALLLLLSSVYADEIPTTNTDPLPYPATLTEITSPNSAVVSHEARVAGKLYLTELPAPTEVQSKRMLIPAGYRMERVSHPPEYICSEYQQPDSFRMVAIKKPAPKSVTVGESNYDTLTIITEGE